MGSRLLHYTQLSGENVNRYRRGGGASGWGGTSMAHAGYMVKRSKCVCFCYNKKHPSAFDPLAADRVLPTLSTIESQD